MGDHLGMMAMGNGSALAERHMFERFVQTNWDTGMPSYSWEEVPPSKKKAPRRKRKR